jgi:hypothetical protein
LDAAREAQTEGNGQRAALQAFGKGFRSHYETPDEDE